MTRRIVAVSLALAALLGARAARAQDTKELESMLDESVVTTASTTAQSASIAPATSVTISAEDLHTYGIRSLAEAIDYLSLAVVTTDPLRTPDIGSRGVLLADDNGKHFLLLIDGHAINDPLFGAARFDQGAGVPIEIIDHIEVIVGPGSVLYGSNAMMGVINVVTKSAASFQGGHATAEYEPGRSWRASAGTGFFFDLFGQRAEVTAAAQYYGRFGPDVTFAPQDFGAIFHDTSFVRGGPPIGVWGGTVKAAYFTQAPSALLHLRAGDLEVSVMASSYKRGIPYSTETTSVDFDDADSYELEHSLRVDIKHSLALAPRFRLGSRLYGDMFGYQREVNAVSSNACVRGTGTDTCTYHDVGRSQWAGLEERLLINWLYDGTLVTTLGADGRLQFVQTKQDELAYPSGALLGATAGRIDKTGTIIAPYLQQTWSPLDWLDMNVGARLDIDNRYEPVVSPRAAIAARPIGPDTTFKAIYAEAFRAPTYSETDIANYRIAPSNTLSPERVRSIEGSIEERFARQRLLFGVFRTWWTDLVELQPLSAGDQTRLQAAGVLPNFVPSGILQYGAVSSIENYGLNGAWEGALGGFHYGLNVTEAYTRRNAGSVSEPLAIAPQVFGNAHATYAAGGYIPTVGLVVAYMGPRPADRPLTLGAPIVDTSAIANFRLTLTGKLPLPGLSYRLSASVSTASESPYTAGPNIATTAGGGAIVVPPPLGFVPVDQFNAFGGLTYDFDTGGSP